MQVEIDKQAVREVGGNPLNRVLLSHPKIISSKPSVLGMNESNKNDLLSDISIRNSIDDRFDTSHKYDNSNHLTIKS